ncbi:MAG TPA: histidine--tRNA ligase [Rectinemataceae bacterium]|nr:histidine--tRNA ligase [Rectinemataceae bacterium]
MPDIIEPRVLKGFRDYLPEAEIERSALTEILQKVFRSFGFVPIDTPVLEYAEILLGKGGGETDKQVYRFKDNGDRDVAMRFDLTVPFARFMAEHVDELYLPFRRYHMAKVWRAENTQRGRYREFMQCDFDIVGSDSAMADSDIVLLIRDAFEALGVGGFQIRINHRGLFNRFLAKLGIEEQSAFVLRSVDKKDKLEEAALLPLLEEAIGREKALLVLDFIKPADSFLETLAKLEKLAGGPGADSQRLREIHEAFIASGIALAWNDAAVGNARSEGETLVLDPGITRGLDYYTGVVFETRLDAMPEIGSVCGGGRYDELASLYTNKKLPGVGAAIGLDRLLTALETLGKTSGRVSYSDVLVLFIEDEFGSKYQQLASLLRRMGLVAEVYPEKRKLGQQFAYAEKKGIPFALILGSSEDERGVLSVKDLGSRETFEVANISAVAESIRERLGR